MDDVVVDARACPIDFNHESPEHARNWATEFREIREKCPMAWSRNHGGYWIATRYKDIIAIAQNPTVFTSNKTFNPGTGEVTGGVLIPPLPAPRGIPDETDADEWRGFRSFLNRRFAPNAIEARRADAERLATALINRVIETGNMDLVDDFTNPLPALVTMDFFGFPLDEWRQFADPLHKIAFTPKTSPEMSATVAGMDWIRQRVADEILRKRQEPADDLLTILATGEVDGRPLDDDTIWEISFNLLIGGVDTTTALTSNVLLYLHRHHSERDRLKNSHALWPVAREEFVRYFSPIHGLARNIDCDVTVNGQKMLAGERVLLAFSSANRDPEMFEKPEELNLDRFPNRHIGFGAGMHRCIGSFLARMMFETMLNEVLTRLPDYFIDEDLARSYPSIATVNGWISLPAAFTPGLKIPVDLEL